MSRRLGWARILARTAKRAAILLQAPSPGASFASGAAKERVHGGETSAQDSETEFDQ